MTTATLQFDHPTLFREGRFTRDEAPVTERPEHATAPAPTREHGAEPASRPAPASRGGLTLDELLSAAWDGLAGHHSVPCPVCSGPMAPRYGSGAKPVGGRCTRCGSTLG
jgi:hypothetical protein